MTLPTRAGCLVMTGLIATSWLRAGDLKGTQGQQPFASVAALADAQHIPLQGFDPARDTQMLRPVVRPQLRPQPTAAAIGQ